MGSQYEPIGGLSNGDDDDDDDVLNLWSPIY